MVNLQVIFAALALFQIKHFLCDFPLQSAYMLKKGSSTFEFIKPLAFHSYVHGLGTFLIAYYFTDDANLSCGYGLLDMFVHFTIDRIKASPNLLGRFKVFPEAEKTAYLAAVRKFEAEDATDKIEIGKNIIQRRSLEEKFFWWSLGLDQMLHHITHYYIIYNLLNHIPQGL